MSSRQNPVGDAIEIAASGTFVDWGGGYVVGGAVVGTGYEYHWRRTIWRSARRNSSIRKTLTAPVVSVDGNPHLGKQTRCGCALGVAAVGWSCTPGVFWLPPAFLVMRRMGLGKIRFIPSMVRLVVNLLDRVWSGPLDRPWLFLFLGELFRLVRRAQHQPPILNEKTFQILGICSSIRTTKRYLRKTIHHQT